MMRRRAAVAGILALTLAGFVPPAHAGGKRLPKPVSLVERIRPAPAQTHYVRTASAKHAPTTSPTVTADRPFNQTHFVREGASAR